MSCGDRGVAKGGDMGVRTPPIGPNFLVIFYQNSNKTRIRSASAPLKPPPLAIFGLKTPFSGHFWLRPWIRAMTDVLSCSNFNLTFE